MKGKIMTIDFESLGGGAGTGLLASILGYLGFSRRLNKLEDCKQEKAVCNVTHQNIKNTFDDIKEDTRKIFDKLDDINRFLRNPNK